MSHFNIAKEEVSFYGTEHASLQNLLALVIGPKANPMVTGQLASLGVKGLSSSSKEELLAIDGVSELMVDRINACLGIAGLMNKYNLTDNYKLDSSDAAALLFSDIAYYDQIHFSVAFVNVKNIVIRKKIIYSGTLNATFLQPCDIYKEAMKLNASAICIAHNRPGGSSEPTQNEIDLTNRLAKVGEIIGIRLLDHIIVTHGGKFTSLREKGYME